MKGRVLVAWGSGLSFGRAHLALVAVLSLTVFFGSATTGAAGSGALRTPAGYATNTVARGDDTSNLIVNLPFTMTWNGTAYSQIYINMNGNCTFGSTYVGYDPRTSLVGANENIMAPFFQDVDTSNANSGQVTYSDVTPGNVLIDGHQAFIVTWNDVGYYNAKWDKLNTFQIVLIDRSDTGAGDFDFEFDYDQIKWDRADSTPNNNARMGWAFDKPNTSWEYTRSGQNTHAWLDSSGATALINNTMSPDNQLGRYAFQVRNGIAPNVPPVITRAFTATTIEANTGGATPGLSGYNSTADASASDPDGTIASLVRDPAEGAFLPLGTNTITWTATDNDGAVTVATQTIEVVDTTPPSNPTVVSTTHQPGVWSPEAMVALEWSGATDLVTGISGYSYSWTADAPGLPDTTVDPASGTTTTVAVTLDTESFDPAALPFPSDWTRSNNWVRMSATTFHSAADAAEVYTDSNNRRRTAEFQKTYDLSAYTDATLSFWDYTNNVEAGDFNTVEYSTDGTTWNNLQTRTSDAGWTQRTYSMATGGSSTVTIRFRGSVDRTNESVDWDDIVLSTNEITTVPDPASITSAPGDGQWYFNVRTVDATGNWTAGAAGFGPVLIDTTPPEAPASLTPSNVTSYSIDLSWPAASDAGSGVSYYGIYDDSSGSLVGTTTLTTFTASSLSSGTVYTFDVYTFDEVGLRSGVAARCTTSTPFPDIGLTLTLESDSLFLPAVDPGTDAIGSIGVSVGGTGARPYSLYCSATDFIATGPSSTPTLPIDLMSMGMSGFSPAPSLPLSAAARLLHSSTGEAGPWTHDYTMDFSVNIPWMYEAGDYESQVTYTIVSE